MTANEFLELLRAHPDHRLALVLPDGAAVPAHFHITEVGHIAKTFLDCGGKRHRNEACLLQVWVADDLDHRLEAGKLARIFDRADELLPDMNLPVEFEHEAPALTQMPVSGHEVREGTIRLRLAPKHADCLAKDICLPDFSLPAIPGQDRCVPGGGCC